MCRKRGSCCRKRRKESNHRGHRGTRRKFAFQRPLDRASIPLRLSRMALQKVKPVAQREEDSFQSGKDQEKAVVDAEEQSIVEAPFIGGRTGLHRAIKTASRRHEQAQQQKIKANPEDYPEERADAGK